MRGLTRGSAAIIGAAESDIGAVAALMSPIDLMAQGIHRALADAGLDLTDVDGVFCATTQARTSAMSLVEYLGLPDAYTDSTIVGGSSFEIHVAHAQAALAAGLCSVAVIAYGSTQRTVGRRGASPREYNPYETPFKPFLPATAYAMAANRHMHEFGTTREHLAEVAVAAREWALLNPAAWEKQPLSIADVLNARPISDPLTVRDCCLVTDGGGAIVMTSAERARALGGKAAYVLGCGQSITHATITSMPDLSNPVWCPGVSDGGDAGRRHQHGGVVRRVHDQHDPVPGGPRLLPEGRGRTLCLGRSYWAEGRLAGEHQRGRVVVLPSRHVRSVPADRGGAAIARRVRRAPGGERRDGDRAWQRRRSVCSGNGHSG
jgi:hypothetical protein